MFVSVDASNPTVTKSCLRNGIFDGVSCILIPKYRGHRHPSCNRRKNLCHPELFVGFLEVPCPQAVSAPGPRPRPRPYPRGRPRGWDHRLLRAAAARGGGCPRGAPADASTAVWLRFMGWLHPKRRLGWGSCMVAGVCVKVPKPADRHAGGDAKVGQKGTHSLTNIWDAAALPAGTHLQPAARNWSTDSNWPRSGVCACVAFFFLVRSSRELLAHLSSVSSISCPCTCMQRMFVHYFVCH